jgi:HK97 family phage major capsid protein
MMFADLREDDARAKGYAQKGKLKKEEVFGLIKRTVDPTTVYKKQKLDRDDVVDITDFDVVSWIKGEMRVMLDEEIARAILVGDGRLTSDDDHIPEENVRPIWKEADLFCIKKEVTVGATDDDTAKNFIKAAIKSRKDYRGSGNPTLFTTEDMLTDLLLLEDSIGHKLYKTEAELATALRVSKIVTVPVMENLTRQVTKSGVVYTNTLKGIIVNLTDYNVGADKGGAINMFDDFDIDYNQQKYLIETRMSGALVKPYSAIVLETSAQG